MNNPVFRTELPSLLKHKRWSFSYPHLAGFLTGKYDVRSTKVCSVNMKINILILSIEGKEILIVTVGVTIQYENVKAGYL